VAEFGLSASELADAWPVLSLDERAEGFCLLSEPEMDELFLSLSASDQASLLLALSLPERKRWLRLLLKDAVADVVHEAGRLTLIDLLDEPTRREVEAILTLGDDEESSRKTAPDPVVSLGAPDWDREKLSAGASYPDDEFDSAALDPVEAVKLNEFAAGKLDLEALELEALSGVAPGPADSGDEQPPAVREAPPPDTLPITALRPPVTVRAPPVPALTEAVGRAIQVYRTAGAELVSEAEVSPGAWVNVVNPTALEIAWLNEHLGIETDFLKAALDEEERPRIEVEHGATLIIVDVPALARDGSLDVYTTVPLGIILTKTCVVTVCLRADTVLQDFISGRVKGFVTEYRTRFVLQILHRSATRYLQYLRSIDKASHRIEQELQSSMKNKELIQLLKLEKSLVYFETSLKSNELVLEKLMRVENVRSFPEDRELLEDVIIENKQAIEMANIYSNILSGTMDAFASLISNNLNIVMKVLTSVTIVMAIPTMVSSFFGMNVPLPLAGPFSFVAIIGVSVIGCTAAVLLLWRGRMF
jgi:magnesium transporter